MRILVVGGGGREHALAWKLTQEAEVFVMPGNPGIAEDCEVLGGSMRDYVGILNICKDREIDLVVIGPEDPLIEGLADWLREAGVTVYGPGFGGAKLEGSKAFSKMIMDDASIPTAVFEVFTESAPAVEFARQRYGAGKKVVVKASGNALGKGVIVTSTFEEAADAIERMLVSKLFGSAGETIVVEDRLDGREFSVLTIVGDQNFVSLPIAQDYKRAFDRDQGPNTGGMGAYSPVDWVSADLLAEVEKTIVRPMVDSLAMMRIPYRGTLFSGIMMDGDRPHCLEINVRMGDPETQAVMLRLDQGFAAALEAAATGKWIQAPSVLENASVAIVVSSEQYPLLSSKGAPITIGPLPPSSKLFHAGTMLAGGQLVTNGGRIFSASASGPTLRDARKAAYKAAAAIQFEGARFRSDIAHDV